MIPSITNATLAVLSLLRSPGALNTTGVLSPGCQQDMMKLQTDQRFFSAMQKLQTDERTMGVQAGRWCSSHSHACGDKECCSAAFDWTPYVDDLHALAKAADVDADFRKLCFLDGHLRVTVGTFAMENDIEHEGLLAIGKHCTRADFSALLGIFGDAVCQSLPTVSDCRITMSSPSCGGAEGPCTEYQTMQLLWPHCDAPSEHTAWSINLDAAYGPECSATSPHTQCCYIPLGYNHGPPLGSSCGELCSQQSRKGADDSYCTKSDGSRYGNCFCSSVLS